MTKLKILVLICCLLPGCKNREYNLLTEGQQLNGTVVNIVDGDTFDILTFEKSLHRIRMYGIDCPERVQDYYQAAKKALSDYISDKKIRLKISGKDRFGRVIAVVFADDQNINLTMLTNGHAWHFKKYSADEIFATSELEARNAKRGLWQQSHPIPPWDFRK